FSQRSGGSRMCPSQSMIVVVSAISATPRFNRLGLLIACLDDRPAAVPLLHPPLVLLGEVGPGIAVARPRAGDLLTVGRLRDLGSRGLRIDLRVVRIVGERMIQVAGVHRL